MKKLLVLITLVAVTSAYSQGTINFNNRVSPGIVDAPITYGAGGPATEVRINGAGSLVVGTKDWGGLNAQVALYGGPQGTSVENMVLLVPAVGFRTGAAAGYVNVGSAGSRTIDSVAPGGTGIFQVRAWDIGMAGATSYEDAITRGEYYAGVSPVLTVGPLGGGSPPLAAPNMVGLEGFSLTYVPEPSIIGLGILGTIAGLLVFRRRQ